MKKPILIILLINLFFWMGCDQIDPPYIEENSELAQRTVLIEKFTGHKCSNCPEATRKVNELKDFYGENLISIAIHPGDLIEFTGTDDNYPYDFTTNSSDTIATDMGAIFLPLGTINRINGGISNRCFTKDEWGLEINNLLYNSDGNPLPKNFDIEINTFFNEITKQINIETNISVLNNLDNNYNLCIIIVEDGIIAPQIDGTEYVENYKHNDIYRCAVNSTYGENINDFSFVGLEGQSAYQALHTLIFNEDSNINWTENWDNINNCSVIAYVYNTETMVIEHTEKHHLVNE